MARPIAETPILTGKDAERFVERMHWVESLSEEQRQENIRKHKEALQEANKIINICF